jgi:hypothetical protein
MSSNPKPRRHHHLSREAITRAALDLIDREGRREASTGLSRGATAFREAVGVKLGPAERQHPPASF